MRWVSYISKADSREHVGIEVDGIVHGLPVPYTLLGLLQSGALDQAAQDALAAPWEKTAVDATARLAPIPTPPSIRDFMSFENHVVTSMAAIGREVDPTWYEQPVFYFTNPAAVTRPHDDIAISPGSVQFDFELEVAAIVGRAGSDIPLAEAESYIAGYTILCDWSARDLQEREMRVGLGPAKGKDTATSFGPFMLTPDELEPFRAGKGFDLEMRVAVNGRRYSTGTWSSIYWSFAQMISYASRGTTLRPGDVIGSGTVGTGCILELGRVHGEEAFPWLVPGDHVSIAIDQLGVIESRIIPGVAPVDI